MIKRDYEENKELYKTLAVSKRVALLLAQYQYKHSLTQVQMAQKLDMPLQTYKRLSSPKNTRSVTLENLGKIFENSNISYNDVFNGIYK